MRKNDGEVLCIHQSQTNEKISKCHEALYEFKKSPKDIVSWMCRTLWIFKRFCWKNFFGTTLFLSGRVQFSKNEKLEKKFLILL